MTSNGAPKVVLTHLFFPGTQKCVRQHAVWRHSAAAVFFSPGSGAEQRHIPPCFSLTVSQLAWQGNRPTSFFCPCRLSGRGEVVPGYTSYQLGGSRTICHNALSTVTDFPLPLYSNTVTVTVTTDLCFLPCPITSLQSGLSTVNLWYPWSARQFSCSCCTSQLWWNSPRSRR